MRRGQDVLPDSRAAYSREWLLANGIGGSAFGTAAALPLRADHAHLIVSTPHGRLTSLLLGMEERLLDAEGASEPGSGVAPMPRPGAPVLEDFRLDPWPTWRYRAGETVLDKTLFLVHDHHAVAIVYRHREGSEMDLVASPLLTARDPDAPSSANEIWATLQAAPGRVRIEIEPGGPSLSLWHDGAFMPARARRRLSYEGRAGKEGAIHEEALNTGHVRAHLAPGRALHVIVSIEDDLFRALAREDRLGSPPPRTLAGCVSFLEHGERARRDAWRRATLAGGSSTLKQACAARHADALPEDLPLLDGEDPLVDSGVEAIRCGLVRRGRRLTLVSSLPKASEQGRHTLSAVRALVTLRRFPAAREILESVVEHLDEGLAPSGFDPNDGTPRYDDPAAALWLAIVGELYVRRAEDAEFARAILLPALEGMMHAYRSGTRFGIRVDADGLLVDGEGARRARCDWNSLWFRALIAVGQLARGAGHKEVGAFNLAWAQQHQQRFNEALWDEASGCLFQALGPGGPERGLEPSQLLAVSLPPPSLVGERASRLMATLEEELFTPYGLRERPGAEVVHTAWLGAFYSAHLRVHGRTAEAQGRVRTWLEPLRTLLARGQCAGIPEGFVLTGGAPRPFGDPIFVPAAAEIVRLWIEELDPLESQAPVS